MSRRKTGILGEKLAAGILRDNGYTIIETNYRCAEGEVDIIASHKEELVFVEVRSKKNIEYGTPEESITNRKKEKLRAVAAHYCQDRNVMTLQYRIDVVALELNRQGKITRFAIIENAVGED